MRLHRPIVAMVAAIAITTLAISLGNWQLRRAQEKLELQAARDEAAQHPPANVVAADIEVVGARLPQHVRMTGRFIFEHEVWLENRQMDGRTGFFLITPLRLADDAVALVNRGFVERDPHERTRLPPIARPDTDVTVEGLAVSQPPQVMQLGENTPIDRHRPTIWQNFDFDAFERASGLRAARWVLQQTDGRDDGLLRNWPRFSAGVEKHRGYALQWFGLAALIVVLTLIFGYRALRRRHANLESER